MTQGNEWWSFEESLVAGLKPEPGVYELANREETVIYIGSASNVRLRLQQRLREPTGSCIGRHAVFARVEYTAAFKTREQNLRKLFRDVFGADPLCNT